SSISRVSRVRVDTSFGSTSDSAGTSRTSSKASPSRANFCSNSSSPSIRPSSSPSKENSLSVGGDDLEVRDLHVLGQLRGDARVEPSGPELERRRGPGGDCRPQRLLERPPLQLRGGEPREEHVAAANGRDGLD